MRTTLTLADDVAVRMERIRRARNLTLRETVNDALRRGLRDMETQPRRMKGPRTKTVNLGACLLNHVDDVSETLALAEGETFR